MAFTTHPALARALAERDYSEPTPVQAAMLAPEHASHDLLVSAQTGSGKTVAYGLALAETLLGQDEHFAAAGAPLALIVAPTRELALQVQRELAWLYAATDARIVSCVGGMDPRQEQRQLALGTHIVVGTPGRLRDHLERRRLDVSGLKALVLDEADEMLDLGFREDLEFILKTTPPERRTLLFSATLPRSIAALAKQYQNQAVRVEVGGADGGHADIEYRAIRIAPKEMEHAVVNVLRLIDSPSAIVFCNTRETVRHLQAILQESQFSVVSLSGELSQNERNHALQALRDGRARVCVATDVAARGIDLPNLGLVIHADLPKDAESLQHRSGRTGRAGRKGVSVLLVPPTRRRRTEDLLRSAGVSVTWAAPPTAEDIRALDHERMLRDPMLTEEPTDSDLALGRALLAAHSAEHVAGALARLYRARLPAPEDVTDPGESASRQDRTPRKASERTREDFSGSVWFKLNVGKRRNAEPRWLLPMICRRGNITRQDIGAIRIFDNESAVEISGTAAARFTDALAASAKGADVIIVPLPGGLAALQNDAPAAPRKRHDDKRYDAKPLDAKPIDTKPADAKPDDDKRGHEKPRFEKTTFEKKPNDERRGLEKREHHKREHHASARFAPVARRSDVSPEPARSSAAERPRYEGSKPRQWEPKRTSDARETTPQRKPFQGKRPYAGDKPYAGKPGGDKAGRGPFKPKTGKPGRPPFGEKSPHQKSGPYKGKPKGRLFKS